MISAKDVKNKIRTVQSIEQICRAMKTVAAIRLRRAEQRLETMRLYAGAIQGLVERLAAVTQDHPFLQPRDGKRKAMVLVTSDRGLCGGYNANAVRRALEEGGPEQVAVIAVGRRGVAQMQRRGYRIADRLVPLGGEPDPYQVMRLADRIGRLFSAGEVDEVSAVYTAFHGGTRSQMRREVLLPVTPRAAGADASRGLLAPGTGDVICEPPLPGLLEGVMTRYLRARLAAIVQEASASEHAARVAAMTAASDNAEEMIRSLTLAYNKARQAGITKELTEIVGASEATA